MPNIKKAGHLIEDEEAAQWTGDSRQAVRLALDDTYARVLIALAALAGSKEGES
jgi:hypothetical protein